MIDMIKVVSVSNVFGEAVNRVHKGESVSALFEI
jgi:phosphoribosylpyrophosphate synthetase